jgi:hypothetical protein
MKIATIEAIPYSLQTVRPHKLAMATISEHTLVLVCGRRHGSPPRDRTGRDVAPDVPGTPDHDDHPTTPIRRSVAEDEQDLAAAPIMLGAAQGVGVLLKAEG